jgi:cytochrome c-type biogenesis protein CcmH/NrfG
MGIWLIAAVVVASLLVGALLMLNGYQWFRLRDQQKYYEGRLEEQQKTHAERIRSIGQQLRNMPKRKTDRVPD